MLDEPLDQFTVDMLDALPRQEAEHYSSEANVVSEMAGLTESLAEIERQYAFVAGSLPEYVKYFHRSDLPVGMWSFAAGSKVKAVGGFSEVPQKDGVKQRKLLMVCCQNFAFYPANLLANHGLKGG